MRKLLLTLIVLTATIGALAWYQNAKADIYGSSLILWWRFDNNDVSGTTVTDRGTGHTNGTLVGSPSITSGKMSQSVKFTGTTQDMTSSFKIASQSSGTVSWWQNPTAAFNSGVIREMWSQEQSVSPQIPEFSCQVFSDNNWYCGFNATSDDDRVTLAASTANWVQNQWQMYTLTWSSGGNTVLYRNGIQIGIKSGGTTPNSPLEGMTVGGNTDFLSSTEFPGSIDDFRIYNRVLSVNEIAQLYVNGLYHSNNNF